MQDKYFPTWLHFKLNKIFEIIQASPARCVPSSQNANHSIICRNWTCV